MSEWEIPVWTGKPTKPIHNRPIPEGYDTATLWDPFEVYCSPFFDQRERGVLKFAFRVDDRHVNANGICHGGMLLTFSDSALGYTVMAVSDNEWCVTASMQASFLAPAKIGDLIEVAPEVVRKTRELVFVRGDFRVGQELVMTVTSLWKLLGSRG
jgi:uncharacterized protein (TIGR00369 family)